VNCNFFCGGYAKFFCFTIIDCFNGVAFAAAFAAENTQELL